MSNIKASPLPTFVSKTVKMAAVLGVLLGTTISYVNKNDFVSSIIIMAILGIVFAWLARWLAVTFLRAWLETKIEQYNKTQEEEKKAAAIAAEAKAKTTAAKKSEEIKKK